jgi:hypothetical protein
MVGGGGAGEDDG